MAKQTQSSRTKITLELDQLGVLILQRIVEDARFRFEQNERRALEKGKPLAAVNWKTHLTSTEAMQEQLPEDTRPKRKVAPEKKAPAKTGK